MLFARSKIRQILREFVAQQKPEYQNNRKNFKIKPAVFYKPKLMRRGNYHGRQYCRYCKTFFGEIHYSQFPSPAKRATLFSCYIIKKMRSKFLKGVKFYEYYCEESNRSR